MTDTDAEELRALLHADLMAAAPKTAADIKRVIAESLGTLIEPPRVESVRADQAANTVQIGIVPPMLFGRRPLQSGS